MEEKPVKVDDPKALAKIAKAHPELESNLVSIMMKVIIQVLTSKVKVKRVSKASQASW